MRRPFRREGAAVLVRLSRPEREVLARLPTLLESVGDADEDPAVRRLRPAAHPDDTRADQEFRRLVAGDLEQERRADRLVFGQAVGGPGSELALDEEEADAWLRVLDEARLVLAARLEIEEDGWEARAPSDPALALLHYLSWLQDELVEVLAEGLDG